MTEFVSETLNEALLWRVLDYIRRYPQRWDQRFWVNRTADGTTYDVAGWTWVVHNRRSLRDTSAAMLQLPVTARELLGLTQAQAAHLFFWVSVGPQPSRYKPWTWGKIRHPTFDELVDKVREVTGFVYDPDDDRFRPPGDQLWEPIVPVDPRPHGVERSSP